MTGHCSECLEAITKRDVMRHATRHRVGTDGIFVSDTAPRISDSRDNALYAEHAAVLAGRVTEYGDHAAGCPLDCPYSRGLDYYDGRDGSIEADEDDEETIADQEAHREDWQDYLEFQRTSH